MRSSAGAAACLLAGVFAVAVAGSVYRIPIQVSDSLDVIERVADTPSIRTTFIDALHSSTWKLRPFREVQAKVLLDASQALGDRYHLVFRGYHALGVVVLIALFALIARPRTWSATAAFAFALVVLTGLHTFPGMLREAYPENHFLLVAVYALATFAIAQTSGSVLGDIAATALFVVASLTLESGALLWVIAIAAYASGLRGISRRGLTAMTIAASGYAVLRIGYLHIAAGGLGARATGFGTTTLDPAAQVARFGHDPLLLYGYTVLMSAVSVLLSQPTEGRWEVVSAWRSGHVPPLFWVEMGTSLATTLLIAWYAVKRDPAGRRGWRDPVIAVFAVVLVANAAIGFAYAKVEIISLAGVFYALAAYRAMASVLDTRPRALVAIPLALALTIVSAGWTFRSAGLHYHLRLAASDARGEWGDVVPASIQSPKVRAVVLEVRQQAISQRSLTRFDFPRAYLDWWGDR